MSKQVKIAEICKVTSVSIRIVGGQTLSIEAAATDPECFDLFTVGAGDTIQVLATLNCGEIDTIIDGLKRLRHQE